LGGGGRKGGILMVSLLLKLEWWSPGQRDA
jgi:hypothetical protein